MKRSLIAAVLFVTLVFSASAGATTIVEPAESHFPYQQWVDSARAPTPTATLTVVEDSTGCNGEGSACTREGALTIWSDPRWTDRGGFLHEVGHNFDYLMPVWARTRFLAITHDPRPWRSAPNSPHERFAEAWATCALLGSRIDRRVEGGYTWNPSPGLHRRVCHLIRMAAKFAGSAY